MNARLHTLPIFATAILMISLIGPARILAQNDWISVRGASDRDLYPTESESTVLILVKLGEDVDTSAVRLRLLEVQTGKRTDVGLKEAFSVSPELTPDAQITITAQTASAGLRQGVYTLLVEASIRGDSTKPVDLTLTVNHPEAKLQAIDQRRVEIVRGMVWDDETRGTSLFLRETTGQSWITDLAILPQTFTGTDNKPVDVDLSFASDSLVLLPSESTTGRFNLDGDFPLGRTTGKAELIAPQLKDPVVVQFEVNTRRSRVWIVLLVLLGVALGYVTRRWLQVVVARNEARLAGLDILDRMVVALQDHPDAEFQDKLKRAREELKNGLEQDDIEAIKTAWELAETKLNEHLDDLKVRTEQLVARLTPLLATTDTLLSLPSELRAVLDRYAVEIGNQAAVAKAGRIQTATNEIEKLDRNLKTEIREPISKWKGTINRELETPSNLLPSGVAAFLASAQPQIQTPLNAVVVPNPDITQADLDALLVSIDKVRQTLRDLIRDVHYKFKEELDATLSEFDGLKIPDPGSLADLETAVNEGLKELAPLENNPETGLALLDTRDWLKPMHAAWRTAILRQNEAEEVKTLVSESKFVDAARIAAENVKADQQSAGTRGDVQLGGRDAGEAESDGGGLVHERRTQGFISSYSAPDGRHVAVRTVPEFSTTSTRWLSRSEIEFQKKAASLALTIIAGLVLVVVGYFLFVKDWVGTVEQMAGIVLWAYGLDITIDKGLEEAKKLKAS